jgi:hypothetical protein
VGFVARQHLGLPRHALTLMPLYALAAAAGVLGAARWLHRRLRLERLDLERWTFAFAAFALLVFGASRTLPTVLERAAEHRHAYQEELALAGALRSAWSARARVFCDVTAVETLSDLPARSFVRWQLPDTPLENLRLEHAAGRDVLVVGTEVRAFHLRRNLRELSRAGHLILYRYFPTDAAVAGGSNVKESL